ncbi:formyltransferase family protein [Zoogloea sp.]|uniref:formyltransferase family protein n=1 Tax=Zoogloea sp. TaxID=49181 RepID=UPI0035AE5894
MRILVCSKRDLHGLHFLNRLLPALAGHRLLEVWLSDKTREAENAVPGLVALRFLERTLPEELVFPLVDALPPGAVPSEATFAGLAERYRVPVQVVGDVNSSTARERMAALEPDLVISARFSLLFDAETIAIPRFGMLNVHPGELPIYAGLHAPLRAVLDRADAFACSVHWITPGIDDGPLLDVHRHPIETRRCLLSQVRELYPLAIPTLRAVIDECAAGRRPAGHPQDRRQRRYRSMPSADEFAHLESLGLKLWCPFTYADWLQRFVPPGQSIPLSPALAR